MISTSGRDILKKFVTDVKTLLMDNIIATLQQHYGIWADGRVLPVEKLTTSDASIIYRGRMLRQRLLHIKNNLSADSSNQDAEAVKQLTAEQAFTILNRFCALRMCEERELILPSVGQGFDSEGFASYDAVTGQGQVATRYERYCWYIQSLYDELSIELPAVFDRFSPYGLMWPDEATMVKLFELINNENLVAYYDAQSGETTDFWNEDETLGWIFQYYNSLEDRRKMRDESNRPRNSREMAVRNQFFTPDYVVRFLTDNSLGRIWYEMTSGNTTITSICQYLIHREGETLQPRIIKEPTELSMLDPACGSMHFGLYTFDVMEAIYMDAWDNQPTLLAEYRYTETRETFARLVPKLILENNIHGAEIDPRALQIAALSLWLRAQQSWSKLGVSREERPTIERSHLVLAEPMPGNKKLLKLLTEQLDKPMQKLLLKIWEKMQYVGEAGLLIKMEQEIANEIEELKKNWSKLNAVKSAGLFDSEEKKAEIDAANRAKLQLAKKEAKKEFFTTVVERLQEALRAVSSKLSEEDGYENSLFANDAVRGFAFIELCQKRYDVILMNPPFGEGSENSSNYLNDNYVNWSKNLVCAFFARMQELLTVDGKLGSIFDRTVLIKSSYENFREHHVCGYISFCADTGWNVLDASVETSTLVLTRDSSNQTGLFMDVLDVPSEEKNGLLLKMCKEYSDGIINSRVYECKSVEFENLPNKIIGYYFDETILTIFKNTKMENRGLVSRKGNDFVSFKHPRLFFETIDSKDKSHFYNGGFFTQFYYTYRDIVFWNEDIIRADNQTNIRNLHYQQHSGIGYGKRGEVLDAHILKKGFFFSAEGLAIPAISQPKSFVGLSFLNSCYSQYVINLYCAQHKGNGYVNLLPMPGYDIRQSEIEEIVNEIIDIKRHWFSLDETNLEYHGLIEQLDINDSIDSTFDTLQKQLSSDYSRYQDLVKANDDLWMDLADIEEGCEFRETLNNYKSKRPYEELLSIDGASSQNIINKQVMAQEIIMELVGMAFGRWDMNYALHKKEIPEFGDVFDALPFMPVVSLDAKAQPADYMSIPMDGILMGLPNHPLSLVKRVQEAMRTIWGEKADDYEYELCHLIGVENLQDYFESPQGFFDYHFKRYTKSRRKAPIYWPISSPSGAMTVWVYYPRLSDQTLPHILLMLSKEHTALQSDLTSAQLANDRKQEAKLMNMMAEINFLETELQRVHELPYKPNYDDGVPVTAAPLVNVFRHNGWKNECQDNWNELSSGDYDWSHLAYSIFPQRIREKVKKDWCLALTHGLEELCENKPKEKKARKKKSDDAIQTSLDMD